MLKIIMVSMLAFSLLSGKATASCTRVDGRTNFTVAGHNAFMLAPCQSAQKGWVWYAPTRDTTLPDDSDDLLLSRLRHAGLAIAGIDVGDFYGAPAGLAVYDQFYAAITGHYRFDPKPCLFGRSRGGLEVMGWARNNPTVPRCFAGVYPVLNLSSYPGLAAAAPQFGMTQDQLAAILTTVNPIDTTAPLSDAKLPIYIIHGDADTTVPFDQNVGIFEQRYPSELITVDIGHGHGHDNWPGYWDGQRIYDFIVSKF